VFLAWTTAGTFLWTLALTLAGVFLASRHDQVAAWLDPVTEILLGLLLVAYLWRVLSRRRRDRAA
jgi:membrane protein DedA with SNARE-associated domain